MRKLKNDDRGVTLVEIIVSIAILAIIVLPFLNAFVTATKTNVKAKNEMNATHLATNIMEGIEKNSMKTLAYQFNYPSEGFAIADGFNISDGSSACELLKKSDKFDNVKRLEDISAEIVNKDDVITSCIHKTDASAKIGDTSLQGVGCAQVLFLYVWCAVRHKEIQCSCDSGCKIGRRVGQ